MLFVGCLFLTGYWATVTVTGGAGDGFWRSGRYLAWPPEDWTPNDRSGHDLPDEDPGDVSADEPAWWVSDGTTAVFAPDPGGPLVLARRR